MKTNKSKRITTAAIAAAILSLSAVPFNHASATGKKTKPSVSVQSNNGLNIRYVGEDDGYVFIKISLSQAKEQNSYLQIFDCNGEKLYEEVVTSKEFSRIIKVSPDELKSLDITYQNGNSQIKKTFAINNAAGSKYQVSEVAE